MSYDWSRKSHPQYDTSTGYGNHRHWRSSFQGRMSMDEAEIIIKKNDPYSVLGLKRDCTLDQLKKAYRKRAIECHPDKHPDEIEKYTEMMKLINAAYTILKDRLS